MEISNTDSIKKMENMIRKSSMLRKEIISDGSSGQTAKLKRFVCSSSSYDVLTEIWDVYLKFTSNVNVFSKNLVYVSNIENESWRILICCL